MNIENRDGFKTKWIGREFYHKEITDSTSLDIGRYAKQGSADGTVVCADMQTAGRGRRGRSWQSQKGDNLLFSILMKPDIQPDKASQITLLMALAVTKVLRKDYGFDAKIKWPNDVVINRKKVCGILTEMFLDGSKIDYIVVGCGINVRQTAIPEELIESATSLLLEKSGTYCIEELLDRVLVEFEKYYEGFLETDGLRDFVTEYNEWLISLNEEVRVLDPKDEFCGISKGINESGELIVELADGRIEEVYAGEVSVRGLYGYV